MATLLSEVDPVMAERWHANDWRKMRRSLQVMYATGERHSEVLRRKAGEGDGVLRFRPMVFWLWAENGVLDGRLDGRVDQMIERGLFNELQDLRLKILNGTVAGIHVTPSTDFNSQMPRIDYTRGILQSIGFKEFDAYLSALEPTSHASHTVAGPAFVADLAVEKLRLQGIESMKAGTRRYARKQVAWIRNKLGPRCGTDGVAFCALDATDFLAGQTPTTALTSTLLPFASTSTAAAPADPERWRKRECDVCRDATTGAPKLLHGSEQWETHVNSTGHKRK
ncbi:tRNA dimethylallyltransferase, partial [Irineochytrium annulatum]